MKLLLRLWIFITLWGKDDPWADGETIDAKFAWDLSGPLAKFSDEASNWDEVTP